MRVTWTHASYHSYWNVLALSNERVSKYHCQLRSSKGNVLLVSFIKCSYAFFKRK